jgi:hypothetical protein
LATLLDSLSQNPYDISLHAQHIRLAEASGISEQLVSARQMFTDMWAAGDEVWIPLLDEKLSSTDLGTFAGISEILELYDRAEQDYLCMCYLEFISKYIQIRLFKPSRFCVNISNLSSTDALISQVLKPNLTILMTRFPLDGRVLLLKRWLQKELVISPKYDGPSML